MPYIGNQPAPQNVTSTEITDGTIVNADINASAAIDITKLSTTVVPASGGTFTGNVSFGDNDKAIFGVGDDLQIYHDGSQSYILENGTGNLNIRSNGAGIILADGSGNVMARFLNGNTCDFNFGTTTRLATTSVGADVTGEFIADSYNETYSALSGTSPAVNCETGNSFSLVLSGATTFTFTNPPASGTAYTFSVEIIQDSGASGHTVTWPTSVDWPAATAPTLTATASAKDIFVFTTRDGGTNWYGFTAGQALA